MINNLKENNELDQGFIAEDFSEAGPLPPHQGNILPSEDILIKDISPPQELHISSLQSDIPDAFDKDLQRKEMLLKLSQMEKAALDQPKKVLNKVNVTELSRNLQKLYKNSCLSQKKKKISKKSK